MTTNFYEMILAVAQQIRDRTGIIEGSVGEIRQSGLGLPAFDSFSINNSVPGQEVYTFRQGGVLVGVMTLTYSTTDGKLTNLSFVRS